MLKVNNWGVMVLAAGKGKRMQSEKLKVMHEIKGKPLIDFVITAIEDAKITEKPVVVVNPTDPVVQNFLGGRADYVVQIEALGTGHAVQVAEKLLSGQVENVLVLYGDMPFVRSETIKKITEKHLVEKAVITMATVAVENFMDWKENFMDYGRVVRDNSERIINVVEKKDATPEQLQIKELNVGFYCFQAEWLWKNLKLLKNNNAQGEYYLTDLIHLGFAEGAPIATMAIKPEEAVGINTLEHLKRAEIKLNN